MKHTIELLHNHVLEIQEDGCPESPNTWGDTEIFLVYDHRQFNVEREGYKPKDIFEYLSNKEQYKGSKLDNYFIFKVFAYIHSGVSLSISPNENGFDTWDTSSTGYILVDKNDFDFDLQRKGNKDLKDKTDYQIATHYALNLIKNWNDYLSGDVFRFNVYKKLPYKKYYIRDTPYFGQTIYYDKEDIDDVRGIYGTDYSEVLGYINPNLIDDDIINQVKALK